MRKYSALIATLVLTGVFSLDNSYAQELWPAHGEKFEFNMIGHAHIDPVWLWPWTEGVAETHSTFRSALDRMKEYPDYKFAGGSAQFYEWVEQNDPAMLDEIRQRVNEGRWEIVGGWWIEPDLNIPCGEALVRQGLYGQNTFQRLFGRKARTGFMPDSFGHPISLPQILKGHFLQEYVFLRPIPSERSFPSELFKWEGIDGTQIDGYHIQHSYNLGGGDLRNCIKQMMNDFGDQPMSSFMMYYGVGDHGGGPTIENLNSIERLRIEKGAPKIVYSTIGGYFDKARKNKILKLPVVKDELQIFAPGCFTAESEIKKMNRASEAALLTAEKIASLGSVAWDYNYPKTSFEDAWKRLMFMQFHDIICGTAFVDQSQNCREAFGYVLDVANQSTGLSLQKLEWRVPTEDPDSKYWLVFNPHPWPVRGFVTVDYSWWIPGVEQVEDENGNLLPCQNIEPGSQGFNIRKMLVEVEVPSMGYRQIRMRPGTPLQIMHPAIATDRSLENEFYKVTFDENGTIAVLDKEKQRQLFTYENGCRAIVLNDESDTWSHAVQAFQDVTGMFGSASFELIEKGPLRSTIRVKTMYGDSELIIDWSLSSGSRKICADVKLDWNEHLKMLKFSFPITAAATETTYEIPYGAVTRNNDGKEVPGQRWADITGTSSSGTFGLALLNNAKYGYSASGNELTVTVARSAVYAHHEPVILDENHNNYYWMDQGTQTFRMELIPHAGSWRDNGVVAAAELITSPLQSIYQGIHPGSLPKSHSFISSDQENVLISSIKQAEDGNGLIVRCVEMSGRETNVGINFNLVGSCWNGIMKPFEIKTLRVNIGNGTISETDLLEN